MNKSDRTLIEMFFLLLLFWSIFSGTGASLICYALRFPHIICQCSLLLRSTAAETKPVSFRYNGRVSSGHTCENAMIKQVTNEAVSCVTVTWLSK